MSFSKTSITLALVITMLFSISIISYVNEATKLAISQVDINKRREQIQKLMPLAYDNELLNDTIMMTSLGDLGTSIPVQVYRARMSEQPQGIIILPVAPDGYNGPIKLAVSINYQGTLLSVNILEHNETQGFGDVIHQDNSDWIKNFIGKTSIDLTDENSLDQVSGASVSSKAMTSAVIKCLDFYHREKDLLWEKTNHTKPTK